MSNSTMELQDDTMERYDIRIERYRMNGDFMWRFMSGNELPWQRNYLEDICAYLRSQYGRPESKYKMSEESLSIFEWAVRDSNNVNCQHTIWFFALYLYPGLLQWILGGNAQSPPPPMTDPQAFRFFVQKVLPGLCDELLSGKKCMGIDSFARTARVELITYTGVPIPPLQLREEHEMVRKLAYGNDVSRQTRIAGNNNVPMLEI